MLKNYEILNLDGSKRQVQGQIFTHYIQNIGFKFFWFCEYNEIIVCEINSGGKVCSFPVGMWAINEFTKASKNNIDRLVARVGCEVVYKTLSKCSKGE